MQKVFFSCFIVVVTLLTGLLMKSGQTQAGGPPKKLDAGITEARRYWGGGGNVVGAEQAYAEFKDKYRENPPVAHIIAHVVGDLMYENVGSTALTICDDAFNYGCFHQVVSDTMVDEGSPGLAQLDAFCGQKSDKEMDNCYHGIGHGVLGFFGPKHLTDALDGCATLRQSSSCEAGAFMEYYVPLIIDGTDRSTQVRPMDAKKPYAPCDTAQIQERYKDSCYVALPHWWMQRSLEVKEVAVLCHGLPERSVRSCVEGISVDLPGSVNFDNAKVIAACGTISDLTDRKYCLSASARMIEDFKKDACPIWAYLGEHRKQCG